MVSALITNDDVLLITLLGLGLLYLWDSTNGQGKRSKASSVTNEVAFEDASSEPIEDMPSEVEVSKVDDEVEHLPSSAKLPFLPGCEPDGPAAQEMMKKFPEASTSDIVRYLVARKGAVPAASEMMEKSIKWRSMFFPLKREIMRPAFETGCMFSYGQARDGSPVLYFRGGLYDKRKAPPDVYALSAAHIIDIALKASTSLSVTVLAHTSNIPGAVNETADMAFVKAFVAVLSDNYPERLKRLIIYPFPWYARAMWAMVKPFVDRRTQEKVVLLSDTGATGGPPKELFKYVDIREIPVCCGGLDTRPVIDMLDTIPE